MTRQQEHKTVTETLKKKYTVASTEHWAPKRSRRQHFDSDVT